MPGRRPWQVTAHPRIAAIAVPEDHERVRIAVTGDMDLATAAHVHRAVLNALRHYRPARIELDLAEVEFLDAAGIRALLDCHTDAGHAGCRLVVRRVLPTVHRVLQITGLARLLGVQP
ncbi:MAG TPA: STAS domain-containing protein [Pilimelia sp.]|nr:STAS domain-containing protein [Pilimelia sp.]